MDQKSKKKFSKEPEQHSGFGKIPPQALELEQAVLGAMMIEKNALFQVSGLLKPEDFYHEKHQKVYAAILELFQVGEPIDILTVTTELRKKGELEFVGGAYYVTELTSRINSSAHIETHARIISEKSMMRQFIAIASEIEKRCFDDTEDVFEVKDYIESELSKIETGINSTKIRSVREVARDVLESVAKSMTIPDGITGIPSGFPSIDNITAGWQPGDLIIIAARPSMGKTALAVCNALNSAIRFNCPGAIFSLEMSAEQLVLRMITSELDKLQLTTDRLRRGKISEQEYQAIQQNINELVSSTLFIDDTPALSISRLRSKVFYLIRKYGIKWILVDYLQLMSADSKKNGNREQEIAAISRGLKALAKELGIPVIALSQLSRSVETRGGDKKPILADLRESGAIEQDADLVIFLYRPEYYGILTDQAGNDLTGIGLAIIAKHRNGALDEIPLKFVSKRTKFTDMNAPLPVTSAHDFSNYRDPSGENNQDNDLPF